MVVNMHITCNVTLTTTESADWSLEPSRDSVKVGWSSDRFRVFVKVGRSSEPSRASVKVVWSEPSRASVKAAAVMHTSRKKPITSSGESPR